MRDGRGRAHTFSGTAAITESGAHLINLCGQDTADNATVLKVTTVAKYFRNVQKVKLRELGIPMAPLPGESAGTRSVTCWSGTFSSGENQPGTPASQGRGDVGVFRTFPDVRQHRNVQDLYNVAKTLAVYPDRMQRDRRKNAEACELWLELLACEYVKRNQKAMDFHATPFVRGTRKFFLLRICWFRVSGERDCHHSRRKKG